MRQCWGLQVGPMHETAGMGKLINAALLSLMRRVWVYAVLPSSWVNSSALLVCRHDRVTREVGRVGSGKGSWEEGILSGVVPVYLYCPAFNVCFSRCLVQAYMPAGRPATRHASHRRPRPRLSGARRQGLQQPTNMQPGTFCYRWLGSG